MYLDREQASDDVVLSVGVSPVDYASQLVQIATRLRPLQSLAAIPMAQQSTLRQRVSAVLDTKRPRGSIGRIALVAAIAACCCVVVPVAMLKAATDDSVAKVTDADPSKSNESKAAKQGPQTPLPPIDGANKEEIDEKTLANRKRVDHPAKKTEKIRVVNGDTGEGIPGAMISFDPEANASKVNLYDESLTSVAYTNERGEIELPSNTLDFLQLRVTHSKFLRSRFATPSAVLGGGIMLAKTPWPYGTMDGKKIIRLWPGETVRGTIRFFDGKPVANLKLKFAARVRDKEWLKKTGETIWTMQQADDWESFAITDKRGAFAHGRRAL